MWRRVIVTATIVFFAGASAHAELPTLSKLYRYNAVNRELTDALRGFAADQRLNIMLDPGIESRLISEEVELPPAEFLTYITGKYGLIWYYDGVSIYVYRGSSLATRAFRLRYTTPSQVIETMKQLNAYSDRFPYRIFENGGVILAVAPQRMLDMTALVISTLESAGQSKATASVSVAVFPLRFASAADQNFDFEGSTVVVPGVATILQSLVSGNAVTGKQTTYLPRNLPGLTGYGLERFNPEASVFNPGAQPAEGAQQTLPGAPPGDPAAASQGQTQQPADQSTPGALPIQPTISADTRTNSVVIRDLPDRMDSYREVINALDQPTGLIEITARIIDVTKEGVFEWGLPYDFELGSGDTSHQFSLQLSPTDSANLAVTLLKDEVTQFLGQIKALEQDGYARVASRPSLLTLDNVEAQIDNSETFFVRVEGDFEVDLFDVSIGTTLRINPHVIEQNGKRLIRLNVQVTDGAVLEQTVDEIPRIRSDSITTQAMLGESESLLIGGLFREEKSSVETRIPFLGSLPGIGRLFRSEEYNTSRIERLILIEPRIIAVPTFVDGGMQLTPLQPAAQPCALPGEEYLPSETLPSPAEVPEPEELILPRGLPAQTSSTRSTEVRVADCRPQSAAPATAVKKASRQESPSDRPRLHWPSFPFRKSRGDTAQEHRQPAAEDAGALWSLPPL